MKPANARVPVLGDDALTWANRAVWLACVAVYLTVFIGSLRAGATDLNAMGKAVAFTLAMAIVGRVAVALLSKASLPVETGPMADEDGTVGSLADGVQSPNVPELLDEAEAA